VRGQDCLGAAVAARGEQRERALPVGLGEVAQDAKDIVRLGAGLVGTIAALMLGLLIASAKTSYDTQTNQVQHLTADIVLLDQLLAQYGPGARPIRGLMPQAIGPLVERLWVESGKAEKDTRRLWRLPLPRQRS
jgi:hypothetical protein